MLSRTSAIRSRSTQVLNRRVRSSHNRLFSGGVSARSYGITSQALLSVVPSTVVGSSWFLTHNGHGAQSECTTMILASSPSTLATSKQSFYRQFLRWLQQWWTKAWGFTLVATRTTEVALRLSPLAILSPLALLFDSVYLKNVTWNYLVSSIQGIGPVAVKFAQWIATRRDIFPPTLCDKLGVLHDQGYPHAWIHTDDTLTRAFGDYQAKGLVVNEKDVIGCGSAAQVYRGKMTTQGSNGETIEKMVAIKVLHPKFQKQVDGDLKLITIIAELLHSIPTDVIRMLNLPRATETFGTALCLQADLTYEAENLKQFRSNFYRDSKSKEKNSTIVFPKPLEGWSNPQVIVEEYVDNAVPISQFLHDSSPEGVAVRRDLAGPLLRAFLKMVFLDNFVHGDLHPGNVLVKTTTKKQETSWFWNSSNDEGKEITHHSIVFLDAGITNSLSPDDQRNLKDLFRAVIFNEGEKAGRLMVERAKYERCSQIPGGVDAFAKGVGEIVSEFHDRRKEGLTLGAVRIGGLLGRVLDLCRVHGVEIDPAMASVVISTLVLEGLGRSLSPELNLIDFARPFVMGGGTV